MPILRFKTFEDMDKFEKEGKGINWQFCPDSRYLNKALKFKVKAPFPKGLYKFKTFEEAQTWELKWWIKGGATKRTR